MAATFDSKRCVAYRLPGDWIVIAGRTAADNEFVSLKLSSPRDWWFHVRGMPGSHVILRDREAEEADSDVLKAAAAIAAFHSKARGGGVVAVSCTKAQNVSKARSTKTGTVNIKKERVLKVRPVDRDSLEAMKEPDYTEQT